MCQSHPHSALSSFTSYFIFYYSRLSLKFIIGVHHLRSALEFIAQHQIQNTYINITWQLSSSSSPFVLLLISNTTNIKQKRSMSKTTALISLSSTWVHHFIWVHHSNWVHNFNCIHPVSLLQISFSHTLNHDLNLWQEFIAPLCNIIPIYCFHQVPLRNWVFIKSVAADLTKTKAGETTVRNL